MPSKLPRINFVISQAEYDAVKQYKETHKIKNLSQAYIELISRGLEELQRESAVASVYTPSEKSIISDYRTLDSYGKDAVREVLRVEKERCEDEERFLRETASPFEKEPKIIPDYTFSPAAGPLAGITGQEWMPYELQDDDPQSAIYTTTVQGDSMEPYFPDGSRIFVNNDQMRDGDIGIFCVDGANIIKQWHYDPILKMTYLFSLNRNRDDADVVLPSTGGRSAVCQGRVITSHRFPLPGM